MRSLYLIVAFAGLASLVACSRNENNDSETKARIQVKLTDDPGDYEAVWIDIRDVQINVTGDDQNGWESLAGVRAGSYDLLRLVNDQDTLLADAFISPGRVHQIRLILGSENFLQMGGEMIPLNTPSAQQSGLKINIQHDVEAGLLYTILLDFDVARSIVATGSGKFNLKPVIRGSLNALGGSLKGVVVPDDFPTVVYALQGADTITSTFTNSDGEYCLRGLPASTYHVAFSPSSANYRDSIVGPYVVQTGQVTYVDTLFFQP